MQDMGKLLVPFSEYERFFGTFCRKCDPYWYTPQFMEVPLVRNAGYERIFEPDLAN